MSNFERPHAPSSEINNTGQYGGRDNDIARQQYAVSPPTYDSSARSVSPLPVYRDNSKYETRNRDLRVSPETGFPRFASTPDRDPLSQSPDRLIKTEPRDINDMSSFTGFNEALANLTSKEPARIRLDTQIQYTSPETFAHAESIAADRIRENNTKIENLQKEIRSERGNLGTYRRYVEGCKNGQNSVIRETIIRGDAEYQRNPHNPHYWSQRLRYIRDCKLDALLNERSNLRPSDEYKRMQKMYEERVATTESNIESLNQNLEKEETKRKVLTVQMQGRGLHSSRANRRNIAQSQTDQS